MGIGLQSHLHLWFAWTRRAPVTLPCLISFPPSCICQLGYQLPKLDRNGTETSTSGFPYFRTLNNVSWSGSRAAPAGSQHSYTKKDHQMKKVLAMLFLVLGVSASFAQTTSNVVRWKTIVGNITVSKNDAVAGIKPGTTPWSTTSGRASVNLSTGHVSFDVEGLVLNGGNATGTPDGVDQVEGSLICDAGQQDQTIFTTLPVPLDARGNAEFSGTFDAPPATCNNPLFLIRIGPDLPGANQRWIATGAVRSFGGSDGHN